MDDTAPYTVRPVGTTTPPEDLTITRDGKTMHLLGRSGPLAETRGVDRALNAEAYEHTVIPVILGAGLGHAVRHALGLTTGPVAVVDGDALILQAAGIRNELLDNERVHIIETDDSSAALAALTRVQMDAGGARLVPVLQPAYARLNPELYRALDHHLRTEATAPQNFWQRARYAKFTTSMPRVLLLSSQYFLMGEVLAACQRMEVAHRFVDVGGDERGTAEFVEQLLTAIVEFKPDFVLTINHLGLDREGILADMLERLEVPLASWFVDNPHLILYHYRRLDTPLTAIFTWDADNIDSLRELGFAHVEYLPLAVDHTRFVPPPTPLPPHHPWHSRVSFVGNSMVAKVGHRLKASRPPRTLLRAYRTLAAEFAECECRSVGEFLRTTHPELIDAFDSLDTVERRLSFETLITWEATRQYRTACVEEITRFDPLIVGDPHWPKTLTGAHGPWRSHGELSYYSDLPNFYPASEVNFNCTSKQMKGAVNQRVFDCPACGAFVLSDFREQLAGLFDIGTEAVCYRHTDEIGELVQHYLDHPAEREAIARAGRKRILAHHTYDIRMGQLFERMRALFATA